MAYVSIGYNRGANNEEPYATIGTDDGGNGNHLTVCIDLTKGWTSQEVVDTLRAVARRIENSSYNDLHNV